MWKGLTSPGDRSPGRARERRLTGPVWRRLKTRKDFMIVVTFGLSLRWLNCGMGQEVKGQRAGAKALRCPAGRGGWEQEDKGQEALAKGRIVEETFNDPSCLP